jgi:phosphate starvation-inducible PhoH-like protein
MGQPLKIALEITPNLEPLFGTRDENLRLMEDSLGVRIDLRSDAVHVEGPEESVVACGASFEDFEALRRQGIHPHNGELNGMLRWWWRPGEHAALGGRGRQAALRGPQAHRAAALAQPAPLCGGHRAERHGLRRGPGRHGQDLPGCGHGRGRHQRQAVSRIVLVRPAVEAGERLGFLPGTCRKK